MCVICEGKYEVEEHYLFINCPDITYIPNIIGIEELYCWTCPNIEEISNIIGLELLDCSNSKKLKEIPNIIGLKILDCSNCPNLEKIPNIIGLEKICCYNCPKLEKIPNIVGLKFLNCSNCSNLKEIPDFRGDSPVLSMHSVPSNTTDNKQMDFLNCERCDLIISIPKAFTSYTKNCKWLRRTNNMVQKVKIIQRLQKKRFFIKRLRLSKILFQHLPLEIVNLILN